MIAVAGGAIMIREEDTGFSLRMMYTKRAMVLSFPQKSNVSFAVFEKPKSGKF